MEFEGLLTNTCFLRVRPGRPVTGKSGVSMDSITAGITSDRRRSEKLVCFKLWLKQRNSASLEINGGFQYCWHFSFIIHMTKQTINLVAMYGMKGKNK